MARRLGIAWRTAALLVSVAAALAALGGAVLIWQQERAERRALEGRAAVLAEAIERSLTEAMDEHRPASMRAILGAVARTEGVAGVALADATGAVRYGAGEFPPRVDASPAAAWTPARVSLARAVAGGEACTACHGPGPRGALYVSLDAAPLRVRLAAGAWRMALLVVAALAAAAAAVALLVRGTLNRLEARVAERTAELAAALREANAAREARAADLARLQAIIDSMADGFIFIDADDRVAMVNQAGRALRNLTEGPGRAIRDCHPKAAHGVLDRVLGYLRSGDDTGPAHSIIKEREGRYETTYAPVRGRDGGYLGTVMVIRDISERRSLETRLLDAERLAGLGQMSAQIAHELRNPLNAIDGAAQYLRRRFQGDAEVAEYSGLIGAEVQRVNRFVAELLQVARPADPVLAPASLNRILREAAQKAAVARGLAADAVALDLAPDLPVLDVDGPMVTEALVNLLANAFEAGGAGPPEIASRFEGRGGEGAIVVEVRDRGCGIPAEQREEVLRPFVTTKPTGTGLGLVLVSRAAEQHRARFELAPREGGGTVARLRFPVRRTAVQPAAEVA
ncbi:MAG TPA: ATP-binding protein [Anaeromyxobacteraceae bacterium]|nr:ATP-binding protein [Anaeromyxobacteraceae bacterium]